jgi:hypothetical protein
MTAGPSKFCHPYGSRQKCYFFFTSFTFLHQQMRNFQREGKSTLRSRDPAAGVLKNPRVPSDKGVHYCSFQ